MRLLLISRCAAALVLLASYLPSARAVTLADYPALNQFIDSMVESHGFDRAALRRLFAATPLQPQVVAAIEQPREALPWYAYRRGFVTEERIRLGVRYWRDHRATLARAQRLYGVPAELIVAIIGVESRYGIHQGSNAVLEALLTLSLDYPPRAEFFRNELEEFLLLTRELKLDPSAVKGSYAGALGIPQFISSSYRRYAVDFDGDDQRDLFGDSDDAIGSVANFLNQHGWVAGQPVVDPVRVASRDGPEAEQLDTEPVRTVREWLGRGVFLQRARRAAGPTSGEDERAARLITLQGESGPLYHLGYDNFSVITRYNRSDNYAMAVYQLARMIRSRYQQES
jgi:peptidoglycan lytic transglycosylase B